MLVVAVTSWGRATRSMSGHDMGGKIAYVRNGAIWMYASGEQRRLTAGPKDKQDKRDANPAFSPDGAQLVYSRIDEGFSDLYKLDIASPSSPIALTNHRPDVDVGKVGVPGVSKGYNELALWANDPAMSPDGQSIAFTSDVGTEYPNLRVMSPNGEDARRLAGGLDFSKQTVERPTWAPDSKRVAVANYASERTLGIGQIWAYSLVSEKWTELTDAKEGAYDPAWSPDGEWIAFIMREGGKNNIYVIPTDAQKWTDKYPTPIQLTTAGAYRAPAWAPDGSKLAFLDLNDVSFDLYAGAFVVSANGTPTLQSPQKLTDNANIDANSGLSWGR